MELVIILQESALVSSLLVTGKSVLCGEGEMDYKVGNRALAG